MCIRDRYSTVETIVSTNDQFQSALGRHENVNFGTIPGERQHAFNNAQVPVVQVFGDIPMAFVGMTARRGEAHRVQLVPLTVEVHTDTFSGEMV